VVQEIQKGGTPTNRLFIVLLKQNMESVIKAAHQCDPSIDKARLALAVEKKDLLERDAILMGLTGERFRAIRDCILKNLPSLRSMVELLCKQVQAPARARKK
jgi:hypothetical protein